MSEEQSDEKCCTCVCWYEGKCLANMVEFCGEPVTDEEMLDEVL